MSWSTTLVLFFVVFLEKELDYDHKVELIKLTSISVMVDIFPFFIKDSLLSNQRQRWAHNL